ncbi:unnamed protein product [Rhizoctonia solani]|uniref:Uncharacterized protein n=1 Tax=Rhizoctonia solani TaxID=456999 RepID=A0A8H2XB30_9AGAM|nr:unnamed protein product [Rhizoctonia solani]
MFHLAQNPHLHKNGLTNIHGSASKQMEHFLYVNVANVRGESSHLAHITVRSVKGAEWNGITIAPGWGVA